MYQALYRKYRPTNFDEVTGQSVIKKTLQNAVKQNRISHAYLFTGPRGTGKTTIAKILAKTVNCLHNEDGKPCNECENCIRYNQKDTTDIIEIDAASNNGVDEIREIKNKVNLVPNYGKYKIYIIDEVHMLTIGAFNALLKTLEEPPAHVIFILATTDPYKIPNTILSRCQRFDFKKISIDDIKIRLDYIIKQEQIEIEDEAIKEIARLSDGGMRDSISLLDQAVAYANEKITVQDIHEINGTITKEELKDLLDFINQKDLIKIFKKIDFYNNSGKNLVKLLEELILYLRNVLIYKITPTYFNDQENVKDLYDEISKKVDTKECLERIDIFNNAINQMKNSNNPKLLFELAIIKIINDEESVTKTQIKQNSVINTEPKAEKKVEQKQPERKEEKEETSSFDDSLFKKISEVRINNTLCGFKKIHLLEVREKAPSIRSYILDPEYNEVASLTLEGQIKAASDAYIVFVYENEWQAKKFNSEIAKIEKMLENIYKKKYYVVATFEEHWNKIKEEFNSKKKTYNFINENDMFSEIYQKNEEKNEIENLFHDIIEYDEEEKI